MKLRKIFKGILISLSVLAILFFMIFPFQTTLALAYFLDYIKPKEPKPVYNITWNLLDENCNGKKVKKGFYSYDSERIIYRKLTAGETKEYHLPYGTWDPVFQDPKNEEVYIFFPNGVSMFWQEDDDRIMTKLPAYEAIAFTRPEITEDEDCFRMSYVPANSVLKICYWDEKLCQFVHVDSEDGIFYKKNPDTNLLLSEDTDYPKSDEEFNLFITTKTITEGNEYFTSTLTYDRDKRFQPVKIYYEYVQNDIPIKTLNVELNGTNFIETQFKNPDGAVAANRDITVYVFSDDLPDNAEIYTKTDSEGWLKLQNLPKGEYYYVLH